MRAAGRYVTTTAPVSPRPSGCYQSRRWTIPSQSRLREQFRSDPNVYKTQWVSPIVWHSCGDGSCQRCILDKPGLLAHASSQIWYAQALWGFPEVLDTTDNIPPRKKRNKFRLKSHREIRDVSPCVLPDYQHLAQVRFWSHVALESILVSALFLANLTVPPQAL